MRKLIYELVTPAADTTCIVIKLILWRSMKSPLYSTGTISPLTLEHQTSEIPMNMYIELECRKVEKPTTLNTILQVYALTASSVRVWPY